MTVGKTIVNYSSIVKPLANDLQSLFAKSHEAELNVTSETRTRFAASLPTLGGGSAYRRGL
jgi:hypothetical protein